ncbi:MAG: hypothetical protein KDA41_19110, partial [Planctomycetales bacterium]|nr:hypothetical protein [Planctomycetales bacterium]
AKHASARRRFFVGLNLAVVLFAMSARLAVAEEKVDVFLLAGQSNMQGNAKLRDLPDAWLAPIGNCWFWEGGRFVSFEPGKTRTSTRADEFGPELGFARTLHAFAPARAVYLVKFHRSGQPLHHGWNGNAWVGGEPAPNRLNFYPGLSSDDASAGKHYRDMLVMFQAALQSLRDAGRTPVVRGLIWMQGEQDSKHADSAGAYAESIGRLKRRVEEDLATDAVPFVLGQALPFEPALERFTHRQQLREQQRRVDMRSGAAEATAGCWTVSTDGLPLQADTVHYDAQGQAMLGQLFALGLIQATNHLEMLSGGASETSSR